MIKVVMGNDQRIKGWKRRDAHHRGRFSDRPGKGYRGGATGKRRIGENVFPVQAQQQAGMSQPPDAVFFKGIECDRLPPLADKLVVALFGRFRQTGGLSFFLPAFDIAGLVLSSIGVAKTLRGMMREGGVIPGIAPGHTHLP